MKLIDKLSFPVLIILALFLGTAPLGAQPHLLEKIDMLMAGTLVKPLDIFDLVLHSTPIILLFVKTIRFVFYKEKTET
ncbi:MAG: hypothetical protein QNL62_09310 [Gammaproteobacteria bacterium]|nr:hypothetical protein [Gammaproteobacteria bacterium]